MDFLWDLHHEGRIGDAEAEARAADSKADAVVHEFARLQRRLDRLALGCQALWELLRESTGITDEELATKIREVDLQDGQTNGRMTTQITECPQCRARTNSKRSTCVMCGAPLESKHAFEV
jgi:hypothetical protein